VKYTHFNNKSFTKSVEICLILITKFAKLIQFWRNILQIWQNMYDFGEISLACLTNMHFFFKLVKLWQIIKLNARYLENKAKLRCHLEIIFCTLLINHIFFQIYFILELNELTIWKLTVQYPSLIIDIMWIVFCIQARIFMFQPPKLCFWSRPCQLIQAVNCVYLNSSHKL
jgi:hypothetical protein